MMMMIVISGMHYLLPIEASSLNILKQLLDCGDLNLWIGLLYILVSKCYSYVGFTFYVCIFVNQATG